jgi:hypothetical protein
MMDSKLPGRIEKEYCIKCARMNQVALVIILRRMGANYILFTFFMGGKWKVTVKETKMMPNAEGIVDG